MRTKVSGTMYVIYNYVSYLRLRESQNLTENVEKCVTLERSQFVHKKHCLWLTAVARPEKGLMLNLDLPLFLLKASRTSCEMGKKRKEKRRHIFASSTVTEIERSFNMTQSDCYWVENYLPRGFLTHSKRYVSCTTLWLSNNSSSRQTVWVSSDVKLMEKKVYGTISEITENSMQGLNSRHKWQRKGCCQSIDLLISVYIQAFDWLW